MASLPLSEQLRQRMQAAVEAERARAAAPKQERTIEPQLTNGQTKRTAEAGTAARAGTAVRPEPAAEDDELREWLKSADTPQPAAKTEPAGSRQAGHKPAAVPARTSRPTPRPGRPKMPGRRPLSVRQLALVVITFFAVGALTVAAVNHFARSPSSGPQLSAAQLRQEAANRNQAAAWMAQQVSRDGTVACDKAMCAALTAHGFPSNDLLVLGSTSPDPLSSAVIVETADVHSLFGSSLDTAWAPAVLASFGSGPAGVTVRVIAPHGAAAYLAELSADLAARKEAGAGLLDDSQITVSAVARNQLASGQVDSRLLLALASLAGSEPIDIVKFWNTGPGASAGIPLRFADLAENDQAAHLSSSAYTRAVLADLSTVSPQIRPARTVPAMLQGQSVLQVEFTAPTPLGVFGPQGSP